MKVFYPYKYNKAHQLVPNPSAIHPNLASIQQSHPLTLLRLRWTQWATLNECYYHPFTWKRIQTVWPVCDHTRTKGQGFGSGKVKPHSDHEWTTYSPPHHRDSLPCIETGLSMITWWTLNSPSQSPCVNPLRGSRPTTSTFELRFFFILPRLGESSCFFLLNHFPTICIIDCKGICRRQLLYCRCSEDYPKLYSSCELNNVLINHI